MGSIILAFLLVSLSFLLVGTLSKPKFIYLLHFMLLLTTPWLIILILGRPHLKPQIPNKVICNQTSSNASCLISPEFIFFQADSRKLYGIKDHGVFLPSFLPAFIVGLWITITNGKKKHRIIPLILSIGLILTLLMSKDSGFLSVLWLVLPISTLATLGFYKMINLSLEKQNHLIIRIFSFANLGLLVYETSRLYQIILFHKPFS